VRFITVWCDLGESGKFAPQSLIQKQEVILTISLEHPMAQFGLNKE